MEERHLYEGYPYGKSEMSRDKAIKFISGIKEAKYFTVCGFTWKGAEPRQISKDEAVKIAESNSDCGIEYSLSENKVTIQTWTAIDYD